MSEARYDTGQAYLWRSIGLYHHTQSVGAAPFTLVNLTPATQVYRIDYASLVLSWAHGDANASAELCTYLGDGDYVPFLAVASEAQADVLNPSYRNKYLAQLSLPFWFQGDVAIVLRGESGLGSGSTIYGTVTVSYSYPL